jgi:hypothetical protein
MTGSAAQRNCPSFLFTPLDRLNFLYGSTGGAQCRLPPPPHKKEKKKRKRKSIPTPITLHSLNPGHFRGNPSIKHWVIHLGTEGVKL